MMKISMMCVGGGGVVVNILSRVTVTKDGVWFGNWIYWIPTGRNYK
jgi:hypothetical protein